MTSMPFSQFDIGHDQPCFIIAEAGVNHNGNMDLAHKLIECAKSSGANCIKFQGFVAENLAIPAAQKTRYQIETTGPNQNQLDMLKTLQLTADQQIALKSHCDEIGLLYLCTPYDEENVDMLDSMNVAGYKISSTDTTNLPFLRYIAKKGRPVIVSSGMCSLGEVEMALNVLKSNGLCGQYSVLQCTSEYPTSFHDTHLRVIPTFRQAFGCPVGFSDHTQSVVTGSWSVALGACIVEKHFTLDRNLKGPDHRASLEPQELKQYVDLIRQLELSLGSAVKKPTANELDNKSKAQKSLVAAKLIRQGQIITETDLTQKRPGIGLTPQWIDQIVGKTAKRDIVQNELISLEAIQFNL